MAKQNNIKRTLSSITADTNVSKSSGCKGDQEVFPV